MADLASVLVGPLAGPECKRALGRGWVILVRVLAALALLGAALIVLWFCWISRQTDPYFQPFWYASYGLITLEGMLVTIALVLAPAVLAGSIAGEKERGIMGLLLTTRVSPREIILGRLTGKLSQVAMVALAGVPAAAALAGLVGMRMGTLAVLLGLPAAVAVGGGGIAVLASTVSRRGRDALLTVYLLEVLFLLSPLSTMTGWLSDALDWLGMLNPFMGLPALVWGDALTPSLVASGLWLAIGLAAAAVAGWRLRPATLRPLDGERVLRRGKARGHVPPVDENRPMLWKELYIERVGALGGFGWWLGAILVVLLGGGSLVLAALVAGSGVIAIDASRARDLMRLTLGNTASILECLIEWAVGLRAAVAISSERERGTWDAILTSPLEGRAIIWGKLRGSLHALRWLLAATLLAWTLAALCGAIRPDDYAETVLETMAVATFMAAVGVRTSLSAATATRAMVITIGVWLGASVVVTITAGMLFLVGGALVWLTLQLAAPGSVSFPAWMISAGRYLWPALNDAIYLVITLMLVADTGLRFDRLAGRMAGGRMATAVDRLIHGKPTAPWPPPLEPDRELSVVSSQLSVQESGSVSSSSDNRQLTPDN
jgi:ABC-type transport system involved in multi-copper enzyme maturation permease subunit